jgi:hypothetical protein
VNYSTVQEKLTFLDLEVKVLSFSKTLTLECEQKIYMYLMTTIQKVTSNVREPGSSVGITNDYGLDGPGIESRWGREFSHTSSPAPGPTQPPVQWIPGFSPGVKLPGRGANHPPTYSADVKKGYSSTSIHPLGHLGLLQNCLTYK